VTKSKTPTYTKNALKISELAINLTSIAEDDKKQINEYTLQEVLNEAKYILSCYNESGHMLNEDLDSDDIETRKQAQKQVNQLKKYIIKYNK
jgi:hypothetical protein